MEHTNPKQYLKARVNDAKVNVEGVVMKFSETMPKLDETTGVDKKNQEYSKGQAAGARFDQR